MVDLKEITLANGIAILITAYLLRCRRRYRETIHTEDKLFDGMILITLIGSLVEIASYYVDGATIESGRTLNYITNSLCFAGTVSVGLLWCVFVELKVYNNLEKCMRHAKYLMIPWTIEIIVLIINCFETGIMFSVSESNVYERELGVVIGYGTLVVYFIRSILLVYGYKGPKVKVHFFPVLYFVFPCIAGAAVQFTVYGITSSWVSVAVALGFVQLQLYADNVYRDELSGLYNRRFLNKVLAKQEGESRGSMYGIMMDINDFKHINDAFGHCTGDVAICRMGEVLLKSTPDKGIAIRYAGDEFMVLLPDATEKITRDVMQAINDNLDQFNAQKKEGFNLSVAMGLAKYEKKDSAEDFMRKMDADMYADKNRYNLQ